MRSELFEAFKEFSFSLNDISKTENKLSLRLSVVRFLKVFFGY